MSDQQDIDRWIDELFAAGWKRIRHDTWEDPDGFRHRGPYGAWRTMLADRAAELGVKGEGGHGKA